MFGRALISTALLAAAVACRSERSDAPERPILKSNAAMATGSGTLSEPYSGDVDIELVDAGAEHWRSSPRTVLLDYVQSDQDRRLWFGLHIDADRTVWSYRYAGPQMQASNCGVEHVAPDAQTDDACPYVGSQLVARITPSEFDSFKRAVSRARDEGRIGMMGPWNGPAAALTLPGVGTLHGKMVPIAGCSAFGWGVSQLVSPEAVYVIELLRRLRRTLHLGIQPCGYAMRRTPEIRPGVTGWWMP